MKALLRTVLRRPTGRLTTHRDRHRIAAALSVVPLDLSYILRLFGTDKNRPGGHNYGKTYGRLFQRLRYKSSKIIEIGVLDGSSLLAWRAYFPRAVTVGVDIEDKNHLAVGPRTRFVQTDQSIPEALEALRSAEAPYNVVIDDGSHLSAHQILTFNALFPGLTDGGVFIIEDVQTSFWSGTHIGTQWDGRHVTDPAFTQTCYGWFLELAKYLNHVEFERSDDVDPVKLALAKQITTISFEHNLIVITKGANITPSNTIRN